MKTNNFINQVVKIRNLKVLFIMGVVLSLAACTTISNQDLRDEIKNQNTAGIPDGFDFSTTATSPIQITVLGPNNKPLKRVGVSISFPDGNDSFKFAFKGFTNENGVFSSELEIDQNIKEVLVHAHYIGIPQYHVLPVEMLSNYTIGKQAREPEGFYPEMLATRSFKSGASSKFAILGSWNNKGVPNYKETVRDVIPQSFLDDVNSSLPERRPVPSYNPEYLASNVETNAVIIKTADIWVTFLHEGAGYKNALGYYTYPTDTPPNSLSDIDSLYLIFPNVSYNGSGGGLVSGDKVHIGRFEPGTTVGWFLVSNGYNSSSNSVGNGYHVVYSNKNLNPESDPSKRQHNVMLYDETRDVVVLGFEDLNRENGSDDDFNDAIFYVTSNPVEGIERGDLVSAKKAIDSDGDGVYDYDDDFPFDPTKTNSSYAPSSATNGSLCFEDNWPNMGDYDFNDLVIDYSYEYFTNAFNQLSEIELTLNLQAIGASYHNGFGIQFDIAPNMIKSVSGCEYTEQIITNSSNGCETGQSKATIIIFDNAHKHLRRSADATYVNTQAGTTPVDPKTFTINIEFQNGVVLSDLGKAPYNPFIFSNGTRGREIHLVDFEPTDLADFTLFGTESDVSDPTIDRYYQNKNNMPWALHTPTTFTYPSESINIHVCYPFFDDWAQSEGRSNQDWYYDLPGHRVNTNLFKRP